ncbi:hypothetical protein JTE90_028151 [Oedothorax gibbosus]|uniref:Transformer n=1 Tax=Oedothorax gibbosus TaxID=931172 RepID=A0AAV6VBF6_9ARAC|nr:hypothetical protein JTE90_028151 [Oedothorax gibbosus]
MAISYVNMMKIHKPTHKMSRSSRVSPRGKEPLLKKPVHMSSSIRMSNASRGPLLKRPSPLLKRPLLMTPSKGVHSSRMRSPPHRSVNRHSMHPSPATMDRGLKRLKYEKRKMSPSPNRHPMPSPIPMRQPSPYRDDRYMNARPVASHPSHYRPSPPKKKIKSSSMMMRRPEIPHDRMTPPRREMHPSRPGLLPHPSMQRGHGSSSHNERSFDSRGKGHGDSIPPSHSKRPPPPNIKHPYRDDHYQSPPDDGRYQNIASKEHYTPTLHERFSSVVDSNRTEPRPKYSREDLEQITIDFRPDVKSKSPTLRRIVNPDDVKLVRRTNEGHRPIFDREEIKQAPRDMRDDAHYEKKVTGYSSRHAPVGLPSGVENYEITRHRFDSHHETFHSSGGRSLSDRWQSEAGRKDEAPLDRDHREMAYQRSHMKRNFSDSRPSKGGDQDFRSQKYSGPSTSQSRPEYPPNHHMMAPPDSRNSSSMHRKPISPMDARRKLTERRNSGPPPGMRPDSKSRYPPVEKRYPDMSGRIEKTAHRRSPGPEWKRQSRPDSRERSFSQKSDKYSYNKPLSEKYDLSKNSNYYQDSRESSDSYRGRGSSFRSPRGRGSRGSRGSTRGSYPTRSSFRGGYRGRGAPRRGRISPQVWEHDMYSRTPDQKMDYP